MYQSLADMACERITAAITDTMEGDSNIKAMLDSYNPASSSRFVNFTTSKTDRWETAANRSHINWVILDSGWEGELCRVLESHDQVRAYIKNHSLGFEVPYRYGSESRIYRPDFIVHIDDGHEDPLQLIVEVKGYRGEDVKDKSNTMKTYWVPGVNNLKSFGRWAFVEFGDVYEMEGNLNQAITEQFNKMLVDVTGQKVSA
jgi:type III restriction enzyme